MILRLSDSLSRGLVVAAASLVGLWLSFFSIRAAIARSDSEGDTEQRLEAAVRLEPDNFAYWYLLGRYQQYNLEQPDSGHAEESYRKAIALNPVATDAWLDLATAYELDGNTEKAREAYLQAKKTYPVSADVFWRYGNFLLREGQQAEAYAELRQAIDADPHRAAVAFSRAYRSNPDVDELLDQLLPPKQAVYIDVIWQAVDAEQLAVAKTVWARLIKLQPPPHLMLRDIDHFVARLLQAGEFSEARRVWDEGTATMKLPPLFQLQSSVVWDPSFETDITNAVFSWHYSPLVQGVSVGLDRTVRHFGDQSLRLTFDGKGDPELEAACTLAVVQPSTTYRFSGWIKTEAINSDQGIRFRLRPIGDNQAPVIDTKQVLGTKGWTSVDQDWTSSPSVRQVQICITRIASENADLRISGTAWVDDVNLVPEPAEHHKP